MNGFDQAVRLPDFVVIGAAKSGTTTLYAYLRQHPEIYMPEIKEPCFFDEGVNWDRGIEWYGALFDGAGEHQILGEASTNYTRYPQVKGVPEKMHALIPDAKLIYVMRDPIKRAFSHYVHRWARELHPGREFTKTFREHVASDPMCIDSGRYELQIEKFLEYYDREQVLLLVFEDFLRDPASSLREVHTFLGVGEGVDRVALDKEENKASSLLHHRVRQAIVAPIKQSPLGARAVELVPKNVKEALYRLLLKSPYGRDVEKRLSPPQLSRGDRRFLEQVYAGTLTDLERKYGLDLRAWERAAPDV